MQVLALPHSLLALTAHDACNYPIVYGGRFVEVARLRKAAQAQEAQNESGVSLEAVVEAGAGTEKALDVEVVARMVKALHVAAVDRNSQAHSWAGEVVYGCCSWVVVREAQHLDLLCKKAPSMVAHSGQHCSQNSSADHGIAPGAVDAGLAAE